MDHTEGLRNRFRQSPPAAVPRREPEEDPAPPADKEEDHVDAAESAATPAAAAVDDNVFDCNVCLSMPVNPIVTTCGHVFCWGCIYKWMESFREKTSPPSCPVCKNVLDRDKCIPIYGKGSSEDPRNSVPADPSEEAENIPPRPGPGPREEAPQRHHNPFFPMHMGGFGINFSAGFGFPGVQVGAFGPQMHRVRDDLSPEQRRIQHFLSQLMMFIGLAMLFSLLVYP